nr:helix-turn-helix transcriptional regulator [Micromonospora sp. DSM 115978]
MSASEYLIGDLRRVRELLGLTQEAFAERIHFSAKHVGAIERAERPALPDYLKAVDRAFGTNLMTFYREFVVGEAAPIWYRPFVEYEAKATLIRAFHPLLIPGLLQTEAYARAVIARYGLRGEEADAMLTTRLGRQEILHRRQDPCRLVAVIDESVLHRRAGSPDVMREQLKAMVAACENPNIRVQIIPSDVGVYPGMDGPFVLATVEGRPVGFLEGYLKGRVVESPGNTAELEGVWEDIRDYALPGQQSLDLIMRTADSWT